MSRPKELSPYQPVKLKEGGWAVNLTLNGTCYVDYGKTLKEVLKKCNGLNDAFLNGFAIGKLHKTKEAPND
jgi:hypothetical protein